MAAKTLGSCLKEGREIMSLTLRQVEEITDISNAYLSQLENDKIKKPSANILYKLTTLYNIEFNKLLQLAGVIEKTSDAQKNKILNSVAFSSEKLTNDEEDELLRYLKFLRSEKKNAKQLD